MCLFGDRNYSGGSKYPLSEINTMAAPLGFPMPDPLERDAARTSSLGTCEPSFM